MRLLSTDTDCSMMLVLSSAQGFFSDLSLISPAGQGVAHDHIDLCCQLV